jgi:trigger factor
VFGEAVTAQQLRVAGYPRIEPKTTESTTHLEFSAFSRSIRKSSLAICRGAKSSARCLKWARRNRQDLDILRKQRVRYEPVDRAAAKEDRVVSISSARRTASRSPGGQAKDYPFVLGQGMMLPDFENAVMAQGWRKPRPLK